MLGEFAPLYAAAARLGISGLDEMELWQVGAALGIASDEPTTTGDPAASLPQEYLAARAKAIAEGTPLPDPPLLLRNGRPPSTADLFQQVPQVGKN